MVMAAELFFVIDAWLIAPFRWTGSASLGFLIGTAILAIECVLLGRVSLFCVDRAHSRIGQKYDKEAARHQDLSLKALAENNKAAYLAQNQMAQEAYGKSMSLAVGRLCASLWPVFIALSWMRMRFHDIPFPLPKWLSLGEKSVPYVLIFLILYIAARIAFGRLERWRKRGKIKL
jgi:hypothetical protein